MSERIEINLWIAGKKYSTSCTPGQEEVLRRSAKLAQTQLDLFESRYPQVFDKQDLLAMCLIHFAWQLELKNEDATASEKQISRELERLNQRITDTLNQYN